MGTILPGGDLPVERTCSLCGAHNIDYGAYWIGRTTVVSCLSCLPRLGALLGDGVVAAMTRVANGGINHIGAVDGADFLDRECRILLSEMRARMFRQIASDLAGDRWFRRRQPEQDGIDAEVAPEDAPESPTDQQRSDLLLEDAGPAGPAEIVIPRRRGRPKKT